MIIFKAVSPHKVLSDFTCLSIEHWVQGTLLLYVTWDWQAYWDFADTGHFKHLGSKPGPPAQQANDLTIRPPSCLMVNQMNQNSPFSWSLKGDLSGRK